MNPFLFVLELWNCFKTYCFEREGTNDQGPLKTICEMNVENKSDLNCEDIQCKRSWFSTLSLTMDQPLTWNIPLVAPHQDNPTPVHCSQESLLLYLPRNTILGPQRIPWSVSLDTWEQTTTSAPVSGLLIPDWPDSMTLIISLIARDRNDTY